MWNLKKKSSEKVKNENDLSRTPTSIYVVLKTISCFCRRFGRKLFFCYFLILKAIPHSSIIIPMILFLLYIFLMYCWKMLWIEFNFQKINPKLNKTVFEMKKWSEKQKFSGKETTTQLFDIWMKWKVLLILRTVYDRRHRDTNKMLSEVLARLQES